MHYYTTTQSLHLLLRTENYLTFNSYISLGHKSVVPSSTEYMAELATGDHPSLDSKRLLETRHLRILNARNRRDWKG